MRGAGGGGTWGGGSGSLGGREEPSPGAAAGPGVGSPRGRVPTHRVTPRGSAVRCEQRRQREMSAGKADFPLQAAGQERCGRGAPSLAAAVSSPHPGSPSAAPVRSGGRHARMGAPRMAAAVPQWHPGAVPERGGFQGAVGTEAMRDLRHPTCRGAAVPPLPLPRCLQSSGHRRAGQGAEMSHPSRPSLLPAMAEHRHVFTPPGAHSAPSTTHPFPFALLSRAPCCSGRSPHLAAVPSPGWSRCCPWEAVCTCELCGFVLILHDFSVSGLSITLQQHQPRWGMGCTGGMGCVGGMGGTGRTQQCRGETSPPLLAQGFHLRPWCAPSCSAEVLGAEGRKPPGELCHFQRQPPRSAPPSAPGGGRNPAGAQQPASA